MLNPFDLRSALMARHAQHVVLVHFPIALYIVGVAFDVAALWKKKRDFSDAAFYNLSVAAVFAIPVITTGILAWQLQLEGQALKGILRLHLIFGLLSSLTIWAVWTLHFLARRRDALPVPANYRLALELAGIVLVSLTGHLGGFLSGVNGSP
ncbi:MAG TPA: DUF2231 domain-containing protein [Candidatus Sulfotelmatobacter sp.]|nr:DUF2231 domain-containing protein [Candidatus Sulfotelmatobacter sp.]